MGDGGPGPCRRREFRIFHLRHETLRELVQGGGVCPYLRTLRRLRGRRLVFRDDPAGLRRRESGLAGVLPFDRGDRDSSGDLHLVLVGGEARWGGLQREGPSAGGPPARRGFRGSFLLVIRTWRFWVLVLWTFCINAIHFGFLGLWAGPYLMDAYGLSKPATGTVLSMVAFSIIFGAPFLGFLSDRVLASRKKVLVGGAATLCLCWVALLTFHGNLPYVALCGLFFFMGLTSSASGIIGVMAAKELFPNEIAGTAIGTMNGFPFLAGIIFQPVVGMILDRSGAAASYPPAAYLPVIYFFLAVSAVSFLCSLFVKETFKR